MSIRVGFAKCDIAPALGCPMSGYSSRDHGATAIEDSLEACVLALQNEQTTMALVCTDLIGIDEDTVADVRQRATEATGLAPEQIMICGSHTHFGPSLKPSGYMTDELNAAVSEDYRLNLVDSIAGAIAEACNKLQPAVVGYGSGRAGGISFNRRPVDMTERKAVMHLTMEPDRAVVASLEGAKLADYWPREGHMGPRLTPPLAALDGLSAGLVDNEVPVLRVDTKDGQPLATLISFACHAVVGSEDQYAISADYPGQARWAFEQVIGGPMLFAAGCAGDQVPTWRYGNSRQRVGRALGCQAAKTWQEIQELSDDVPLACMSRQVKLPLPADFPTVAEAQKELDAIADKNSSEYRSKSHRFTHVEKVWSRDPVQHEMWAARIGDMGIICTPGETLVEIGIQMKQRSPFPFTSVISIANGDTGYLCTDNAIKEGGYEPGEGYNPSGPGTEKVLVENGLEMLKELHGGE